MITGPNTGTEDHCLLEHNSRLAQLIETYTSLFMKYISFWCFVIPRDLASKHLNFKSQTDISMMEFVVSWNNVREMLEILDIFFENT